MVPTHQDQLVLHEALPVHLHQLVCQVAVHLGHLVDVRRVSECNMEDKGEAATSFCFPQEVGREFKLVRIRGTAEGATVGFS